MINVYSDFGVKWKIQILKKDNIQMHYFDYTVREWMPNLNAFAQEEKIVKDFVKGLKEMSKKV